MKVLLGVSAAGVLAAASLAGAFVLRSSAAEDPNSDTAAASLPSLSSPDAPQLSQAWKSARETGGALEGDATALTQRWRDFTLALKKIYPEAPEVNDGASASSALEKATAWAAERMKAASDSRAAGADQARDAVLTEIAALKSDLETLRKYRDAPLSAKLKGLLILGADRSGPKGIDLVWIPDSSKGSSGGFWAARRETSLEQYKSVSGSDPSTLFRKPTGGGKVDDAEIERRVADARAAQLATVPSANREAATLAFDARSAPALRAKYRAEALQRAQQASAGYEKMPTDLANMSSKADSAPFLSKLQQSDLPGGDWKYRLPTEAEWTLLKGRVEGIGTPDLSEWLADSSTAVDRNWKSEQATSPPAPGTVGFRVVLSGQ